MKYQIIIEGDDYKKTYKFFEEIQNKYGLYDNCVFVESPDSDTIVDEERIGPEFGVLG